MHIGLDSNHLLCTYHLVRVLYSSVLVRGRCNVAHCSRLCD
jgi:hypothetical protein